MNRPARKGFAILLALTVVVLIGGALVTMTRGSSALAFQTDQILREAHSRNLHASALAWAKRNSKALADLSPGKPRTLAAEGLGVSQAKLTVAPDKSDSRGLHVKVRGEFVLRGRPFRREAGYRLTR